MDLQRVITRTPRDCNPITMLIIKKLRFPHDIPNGALVDELRTLLLDESNNYLIDEE